LINPTMLRTALSRYLSHRHKRALKSKISKVKETFASILLRYDGMKLKARLRKHGISESDTVLVHSNFKPDSGFNGTPLDLANAFAELVGDRGNLMMVSIPFRGAAYDYLALGKMFNVRKTISMMGLVTEMFRRRQGTRRSLHPTHPVLVYGNDAEWLVAGHERCLYPCGAGSPFEKFYQLKGKILFYDVSFGAITFFHFVEDLLKARLPFPVYSDRLFSVPVIDADGNNRVVQTYAFNSEVPRRADRLEAEMERQGKIRHGRIGNSHFCLVTAEDVVGCFTEMVEKGFLPYELMTNGAQERRWDNE